MSRQRYEPVPQQDEVIILDNIHNSPNYNYNSAIPNSVSSHAPSIASQSQYAPSILAPSVPSSPPPSFHTHSSPGTPRPTQSIRTAHSNPSYAELWGVAPSTTGGAPTETEIGGIGTSNDALATIAGLRTRVEWLEESLGRLLLEKDNAARGLAEGGGVDIAAGSRERNNCCVTFSDASPDLERSLAQGHNCCVRFRSSKDRDLGRDHKHRAALFVARCVFGILVLMIVLMFFAARGNSRGMGVHGEEMGGVHGEEMVGAVDMD